MNVFRKLGFKKANEKEVNLSNKALRFSWLFYTIALIVWGGIEFIQQGHTSIYSIILIITFSGQSIYMIFYILYLKKTNR